MKLLIVTLLLCGNTFASTSYVFESQQGTLSGLAVGKPSMMKVKLEGPGPTGTLNEDNGTLSGKLTFDLNQLKTGIDLRDQHMKEKYLETQTYQTATLELSNVKLQNNNIEQDFEGQLTLKDQTHPVKGKFQSDNNKITAKFNFSMKEFNINTPKYLGVEISDQVDLEIKADVRKL